MKLLRNKHNILSILMFICLSNTPMIAQELRFKKVQYLLAKMKIGRPSLIGKRIPKKNAQIVAQRLLPSDKL